jgi:long-chain acyl-CoA synthetase
MYSDKPWLKFYDDVPEFLDYPRVTMYEALAQTAQKYPERIAYDFLDYECSFKQFIHDIDTCANALASVGLKQGDCITVAMPTSPQGVICFYAANKLGVVASMIHPLSTAKEIVFYANVSKSRCALTMEEHYGKFKEVQNETKLEMLILSNHADGFPDTDKKTLPDHPDTQVRWWKNLMLAPHPQAPKSTMGTDELAVILYSGGTTGIPKGIMLSNFNFITQGMMCAELRKEPHGGVPMSMIASMPIFHGYGLGIGCNAMFMSGGKSILVPQFTPDLIADLVKRKRPTTISGVPTLYDALIRNPIFQNADLSCLKIATCGADTLPRTVKESFDALVAKQGGRVKLVEGYGLTEAVTGIMVTPPAHYREGSVGIPYPDMLAKIVKIDTTDEVPAGEEGELCLNGPAVMMGYLEQPEETAKTLKRHADGKVWLHTGDIFTMSAEGFFYFKLRYKRMIKSSGMNVYPAQVEAVLYQHPAVRDACVIGIPDPAQIERVKAYVVLKDQSKASPEMEKTLIGHCREHLIKWSCPRDIEFRDTLPLTRVGKIAYTVLQQEEIAKMKDKKK